MRTSTVMEVGEYAVRGGILDLFPASRTQPLRLDFFGDELESIRIFDPGKPAYQTKVKLASFLLLPSGEAPFGQKVIAVPGTLPGAFWARPMQMTCSMNPLPQATAMRGWSTGCPCSMTAWKRYLTICPRRWWCLMPIVRRRAGTAGTGRGPFPVPAAGLGTQVLWCCGLQGCPQGRDVPGRNGFQKALAGRQLRYLTAFETPETEGGILTVSLACEAGAQFCPGADQ